MDQRKQRLLDTLSYLIREGHDDPEVAHTEADEALLNYIDDPDIREAYDAVEKWYA